MGNRIVYECTSFVGRNKSGTLKPDADGYYTVVLGALDFFNSKGQFYSYAGSRQIFEESSEFMRRIKAGRQYGEWGHPRPYGMTERDFFMRIHDIYEPNVAMHIRRCWIDESQIRDENGRSVVAIMGEITPAGPKAGEFRALLERPGIDICFSLRSLTREKVVNGVLHKCIVDMKTFDVVIEPGLSVAAKINSPSLESMPLSHSVIHDIVSNQLPGLSMESKASMQHTLDLMESEQSERKLPASARLR